MAKTTWTLDPDHTQVELAVKHMMFTTVRGQFRGVNGTIQVDEEDPSASSVAVEIDAATIDTGVEQRDDHLRSGDFLHVEEHPTITFRSKRVEGASFEPGDEFRVVGDLTIRGTTKEIELDAVYEGTGQDPWGGQRAGFTARTTIDRREWGLEWNQTLETGGVLVGHDVDIELRVQAVKQEAEAEAETEEAAV